MQQSIWPLAFLPYLLWFGSPVDGATVLTSPASPVRMLQPQNLKMNSPNGLPSGLIVIDKERGAELPAVDVFGMGIAWALRGIVLGVSLNKGQAKVVQRAFVISGIYFIFSLMKSENDFRSGVFEIQYGGNFVCDIVIFTTGSSGLNTLPSFAHVTQLASPPSPIAYNTTTNSSSQLVASALGLSDQTSMDISTIEPFQPLDQLDLLLSLLDALVTIALPPEDEHVQSHTENTVFGVKTSISPVIDARPPNVMTYEHLIWAVGVTSFSISHVKDESERWLLGALEIRMYRNRVYVGGFTMVPANSSAPTSLRTGVDGNAFTGTATARQKRWIA